MDELARWAITTAVGILCLLVGRYWGKNDIRVKKDHEMLEKLLSLLPIEGNAIGLLRKYDFGNLFADQDINELFKFKNYCNRPDVFFFNKDLENLKQQLVQTLNSFLDCVIQETFLSNTDLSLRLIPEAEEVADRRFRHMMRQTYPGRAMIDLSDDEKEKGSCINSVQGD